MRLHHGDCREAMRELPENSVDAIVTDPPYGLEFMGKEWDKLDHGLPQENVWKGRRGQGGAGFDDKPTVAFNGDVRGASFGGTRTPGKRCQKCGKRSFSGSPCVCDEPEWVLEHRQEAPSSMVRMQRWHESWAREAYRVLKPGGHLLAFGGSRTYHRLACAVEDAGFEIRDQLQWLYGSGFPKSLDVSKAMDKARDDYPAIRAVVEFIRAAASASGHGYTSINDALGATAVAEHFLKPSRGNAACPAWEQWLELKDLLGFGDEMDAEVWRLNGRKGQPGEAWHEREIIGSNANIRLNHKGSEKHTPNVHKSAADIDITVPATDLARQWEGWGTALKPAHEPIVLARKPLIGTVAANVTEHGTGALNIAATRIETDSRPLRDARLAQPSAGVYGDGLNGSRAIGETTLGRWPANVCLDEGAAALLDAQSGERAPGRRGVGRGPSDGIYGDGLNSPRSEPMYGDAGGASRFFYTAKASRAERNAGLDGMPERMASVGNKEAAGRDGTKPGNALPGGARDRVERGESPTIPRANHHPTVKPIALMRWLVRLVTPPGGTVLDPFLGSGTTGIAAALEGFDFIGVEQDAEYLEIAQRRIAHAETHGENWLKAGKSASAPRQSGVYANGKGRRAVPRCPEHDGTLPSGWNTYTCGCKLVYRDYTASTEDPDSALDYGPLFAMVAD